VSERPANEPTALYRLYDANNALLYLGITWDPDWRMKGHLLDKEWMHLVVRRTVEWYPDRPSALAAEAAATETEKPLHDSSWRRTDHDDKPQWRDIEGRKAVIDGLTREIREGAYQDGTVLMTGAVAEQFGVARATASAAMRELHNRGVLRFWYHGRYRVPPAASC
jgi:predicted GIY-YIG superfamily endonuclease